MPSRARDPFAAIADPTRRSIPVLLPHQTTLTAGEIATRFPRISRPAVSKHLGVLRRARLVTARERGREWHYRLEPGPLRGIYRDWLMGFAPLWEESLTRLKRQVERGA